MRLYSLDTVFTFGKHQGQTLREVAASNFGYLSFCLLHLDHFAVRRETIEHILQQNPKFSFPAEAWAKLDEKEAKFDEPDDDDDYENYSSRDRDRDTFDALTDGQYGDYDDWNGNSDALEDAMGM